MKPYFWDAFIELHYYTYYLPRPDFVSPDSVFSSWVMVVSERGEFEWETTNAAEEIISGNAGFGDLLCAAPHAPFRRRVTTASLTYHVLQWSFVDGSGKKIEVSLPPGKLPVRDTARLASALANLKSLHGKVDAWSKRRQAHLLEELLHLAWQTHIEPAKATDPAMREAAQLLHQRAGETFSMQEVSSAFGLGPVQFTRRFHAAHGCNPIEYLTRRRLEMAQELLIETALSLDEIAFRCGWSSGAYLSHVFNRLLLTTPGNFRRTRRV